MVKRPPPPLCRTAFFYDASLNSLVSLVYPAQFQDPPVLPNYRPGAAHARFSVDLLFPEGLSGIFNFQDINSGNFLIYRFSRGVFQRSIQPVQ